MFALTDTTGKLLIIVGTPYNYKWILRFENGGKFSIQLYKADLSKIFFFLCAVVNTVCW